MAQTPTQTTKLKPRLPCRTTCYGPRAGISSPSDSRCSALQDNDNNPLTGTQAGFTFGPNETANFTSTGAINTSTGLAYASYMLGAVDGSTVTQNAVIETGGRYKTYAPYVQDNIQVTPN